MANLNAILASLEKVKQRGPGSYFACCPVHQEKTPSLSVREADNGNIIAHCFGCGANGIDVVEALGLPKGYLFAESLESNNERYFTAKQLHELDIQAWYCLLAVYDVHAGKKLRSHDYHKYAKCRKNLNSVYQDLKRSGQENLCGKIDTLRLLSKLDSDVVNRAISARKVIKLMSKKVA